jgi:hypothetical protein
MNLKKTEDRIMLGWAVSELICLGAIIYGCIEGEWVLLSLIVFMVIITMMAGVSLEEAKKPKRRKLWSTR